LRNPDFTDAETFYKKNNPSSTCFYFDQLKLTDRKPRENIDETPVFRNICFARLDYLHSAGARISATSF